jgi:hypothetical protein
LVGAQSIRKEFLETERTYYKNLPSEWPSNSTATRPDGSQEEALRERRRNAWSIKRHGFNPDVVLREYSSRVDGTFQSRKELEQTNPELVAARDAIVVQQKKEQLQKELEAREQVRLRSIGMQMRI